MVNLGNAIELIRARRATVSGERALLVAISGIDGSGKSFIADKVVAGLMAKGLRVAGIGIDGWLELPQRRFSKERPAEHFYEQGIRWQEMFEKLVLPLKAARSWRVEADFADATPRTEYRKHLYEFADVDVIVLEGVFLLKRAFRPYYDLAMWVECTFATALERAVKRGQEGLAADATIREFEGVYFPAQRIHLAKDDPRAAADLIIDNDRTGAAG